MKNLNNLFLIEFILSIVPKIILKAKLSKNEIILFLKKQDITNLLFILKNHLNLKFEQLISISGIDYLNKKERFEVIYNLLSLNFNYRIKLKVMVNEFSTIPTSSNIFKCATWYEREVWDMFGIIFFKNPDLRRILTDYGFEGHPMRKDFPQTGFLEVRYDDEKKSILYEPLELSQEFRTFDFLSPWLSVK